MAFRLSLLLLFLSATAAAQDSTRVLRDSTRVAAAHAAGPPVPYSPPDSARFQLLRLAFRWPAREGAISYWLEVARDPVFLSVVFRDTALVDTTVRCDSLLENDSTYFWHVGWTDSTGNTAFSASRTFTTGPPPAFSLSSYFFPSTPIGDTAVVQVYFRNSVADTVTIDSVATSTGLFWLPDSIPFLIGPSDSVQFRVCFSPRFFNLYEDSVTVYTSQGKGALLVGGDSPPPVLSVVTRDLQLGPVAATDTAVGTVVIRNTALINDLSVLKVATRTPFFIPVTPALPVHPEDSLTLAVRFNVQAFRPEGFGVYYDTLTVITDGGIGKVVMRGDSPPPRIITSVRAADFGLVGALDTSLTVLHVRNSSINPLRIDSVKTKSRAFRPLVSRGKVSRADTLELAVRFQPDRYGPFVDTLVCYNNSWTGPLRIPLAGYSPFPVLETDYEQVGFGAVEKRDSGAVSVRITNSSISFLKVDSIRTKTRHFRLASPPLPQLVRMGETLRLTISFFPDSVRQFNDTLIVINSSRIPRLTIPLTGQGVPPSHEEMRLAGGGAYQLFTNYPNPFRTMTTFAYNIPVRSHVRLEVWSTLGQRVAVVVDADQDSGMRTAPWETDLPSGVYYYRFTAVAIDGSGRQFVESRRMMVVR
jgi:hypothetical protein